MRLKLYRGKWCAVWREGGTTKRVSFRTSDRAAAERQLRDLKIERPGDTIGEIVTSYLAEKKGAARSYASMVTAWKAAAPTFAALRPDQVNKLLCRSYAVRRRKGGVGDGTIIKDLGLLKAAIRWAGKGAAANFEMPHAPPPRDRYLTKAEYARLVEGCESAHVALFVALALGTAGRAAAILELTWDRIDFERGQIRLSKGDGGRKGRATVPMTGPVRKALETAHSARTSEFVIEWGGQPVRSVKRSFAAACKRAKLEDVTPHTMRHTAAVWMAEAGVPMVEIAAYLGHTNPAITYKVYAKYSPEHLRRAAQALE